MIIELETISKATGIAVSDITGKKRHHSISDARTIAVMCLKMRLPSDKIVKVFNFHPSAITWHVKKYRKFVKNNDAKFMELINIINFNNIGNQLVI